MCGRSKPASSPPDTAGQRVADRAVRIAEAGRGWLLIAVVVVLLILAGLPSEHGTLTLELVAFALGAAYCLLNFWRCREAHCVVTGLGWAALSVLTAAGLALGHSLVGGFEQVVFLGILVLALGFEAAWRAWTGTHALGRASTADCGPDQQPTGRSR